MKQIFCVIFSTFIVSYSTNPMGFWIVMVVKRMVTKSFLSLLGFTKHQNVDNEKLYIEMQSSRIPNLKLVLMIGRIHIKSNTFKKQKETSIFNFKHFQICMCSFIGNFFWVYQHRTINKRECKGREDYKEDH
jgi:hypothetical protein